MGGSNQAAQVMVAAAVQAQLQQLQQQQNVAAAAASQQQATLNNTTLLNAATVSNPNIVTLDTQKALFSLASNRQATPTSASQLTFLSTPTKVAPPPTSETHSKLTQLLVKPEVSRNLSSLDMSDDNVHTH